jgi:hypothetical protein
MKKVSIEIAELLQKVGFHEKTNSFYLAKTSNAKYELYEDGEYRDWNEECENAIYNAVMSAPMSTCQTHSPLLCRDSPPR